MRRKRRINAALQCVSLPNLFTSKKILQHWMSCCTQKQTHIDGQLKRHWLGPPGRSAEHTTPRAALLKIQWFLALF